MKKFLFTLSLMLIFSFGGSYATEPEYLELNCEKANLQESSISQKVIYQVTVFDTLKNLEQNGSWYKVLCNNNVTGYIHGKFIKSHTDPRAEKIVEIAHTKINCPYVSPGGYGPNQFDCSGLIKWLLKQVTYRPQKAIISNGPQYQINQLTLDIPLNEVMANKDNLDAVLLPGDVFYYKMGNEDRVSDHCALYVGDNYIIHAKGRKYGVVKEKIPNSYLKKTVAVKRVFENGNVYVKAERLLDQDK